ncbi:HEAT repeat domain-containing protein [Haloarcula nitratireducens]|uniref:HEAT repeat domain-containing protein n=1 Tax=Haloarcula nitratireducens TaxID=2487749 RepID=A0AAW4PGD5_9EURY|nr:HEAT repeat domain-containing protein [Halomicroarcula nitratireducens]MBX0296683.1 HEAT repeat domain-containing protein [Halomicroarcula nitratireducens]
MNIQLENIRSRIRYGGRGIANESVIQFIKKLWDQIGGFGYGVAVAALFVAAYFLFSIVFGTASAAFSAADIGALASLVAFVYASWIGFITYEEYTDRTLSRSIRARPSIATVDDAFGLLQSNDEEARVNASYCLSAVVATSPKNVVNTTEAPTDDIVEYLLPYLRDDNREISENIGNVISFMARDYPESVEPFQTELLGLITGSMLADDVRGYLALAIGFLILSKGADDVNSFQETALELSEDKHPDVRIGTCYMLAGIPARETRQRLQEMARNDPEQEVREHAEELV